MTTSKKVLIGICLTASIAVSAAAVFFSVPVLGSISGNKTEKEPIVQKQRSSIVAGGEHFLVDIAKTPAEREHGLSGRTGLAQNEAMIFIFDIEDRYGFWMKDMLFPIDIVWLDAEYRVVYIKSNAEPASYPEAFYPETKAKYVIEFPSGTAERLSLKKGSLISLVSED